MKVLLINESSRGIGGIHKVVDQHIRCLENNNINFKIFEYSNHEFHNSNLISKIKIYLSCICGSFLRFELHSLIKDYQPDIIHIHNIYPLLFNTVFKELINSNAKIIYHIHNYFPFCLNSYFYTKSMICTVCAKNNDSWMGILNKCCNNSFLISILWVLVRVKPQTFLKFFRVDIFIAVSNFVKDIYIKYGFESKKIKVIYNPTSDVSIRANTNNCDYILYIGQIIEKKGIFTLFQAVQLLPYIKFKIAGAGKDLEKLRSLSKNLDNVEFVGFVDGLEKEKLISNCRFIIVPSEWWETFGLVAIEGNMHGKYILTTGCGGLSEIINNKISGEFFEPKNVKELILKIKNLWKDLDIIKIEKSCKENALKYSQNVFSDKIIKLYEQILI